jgi:hypothetical protein
VPDLRRDVVTDRPDELLALQTMSERVGTRDERLVDALQVGDDEVLLAREVAVEGRERDLAGRDDPVDPDAVDPLGVEELRRGRE